MTNTLRTAAQIEAAIAVVSSMIDEVEAFLQALRNEPAKNVWVVGFPQYGLYVHPKGGIGSVLATRLMDMPTACALASRVTNGKGETAVAIDYERALDMVLSSQEDLRSFMCGQYRELLEELVERREIDAQIAADEAECERLDAMADEAAYYDQFDVNSSWYGDDDHYDQRRDERAEWEADRRQDR